MKNDGGPAFPVDTSTNFPANDGMSLRDWFAGQALASQTYDGPPSGNQKALAAWAYKVSDAMLDERKEN